MAIIRDIRTNMPPDRDASRVCALAETRLALLRTLPVLHGANNFKDMQSEQRLHDLAWRLGYAASQLDNLLHRLNMLVPQEQTQPEPSNA